MIKMIEKEVSDALHVLLHCALKDKEYETQKEQFNFVYDYIFKLENNWNELNKLIDERIGDCRYFLANADVNYEKENMKKFMWLKEELQILKSKAQELEQGKDE